MRRAPRIVKVRELQYLTPTRITVKSRAGRHAVGDTVIVITRDSVTRGMVLEELDAPSAWFAQQPRSWYVIQVGAEAEDDSGIACVCRPTQEDSSPDPLCTAVHAVTVDSWKDEA